MSRADLEITVTALVDTGAPYTLFARGVGDSLDIPFADLRAPRRSHYIGGAARDAQSDHLNLSLASFDGLTWQAEVGFFLDDWQLPFAGVLGQSGFLDRWVVSFNYSMNYFVVEEPDAFTDRLTADYTHIVEQRDTGWKGR